MSELPKYSGHIRSVLNQVRLRAERVRQTTRDVLPEDKPEKGTLTVRQSTSWLDDLTSGAVGVTEAVLMAAFVPFLVFFMLSWQDHVRSSTVMLFSVENRNTALRHPGTDFADDSRLHRGQLHHWSDPGSHQHHRILDSRRTLFLRHRDDQRNRQPAALSRDCACDHSSRDGQHGLC